MPLFGASSFLAACIPGLMTQTKRIGILGSGDVGMALGSGFARHGWDVKIGTRSPEKLAEWVKSTSGTVSVGSLADAAGHGDVVVLATLGEGVMNAIDLAGIANFSGKVVLDATNPLESSEGVPPSLFVGTTDSLGECVQRKLPQAHIVKCFNTVPNSQMVDPVYKDGTPLMMICGDDASAKKRTEAILKELGWPGALDIGGIDGSRWLEAIVPLWVRTGVALGTWSHAFKVVQ